MSYATSYTNDELQPNNSCQFYGSSADIQNYTDYGAVIFQKCRDKFRELIIGSNEGYQLNTTQDLTISEVEIDAVMSIKDIVDKARDVFGLSAIQVASLVGVSRPSLYNHMSSKEMPKDISAYNDLYTLALAVESEININLKKGLKNVLVDGRTLLDYLKSKPIDHQEIIRVAKQVANKLSDSSKNPKYSLNEQRRKTRLASKAG